MILFTDFIDDVYGSHEEAVEEAIRRLDYDNNSGHRDAELPFSAEEIEREIELMRDDEVENFFYLADLCKGRFYVRGTLEMWDRKREVWAVFDSLRAAIDAMTNEADHFELHEDEYGNASASAWHHDGTNQFTIYRMTDEANVFYEENRHELTYKEMERELFMLCKNAHLIEMFG